MFFEVERILEEKKPKSFLLENVKGLTNHDKGNTFKTMLDILENKLGYKVYYKVLNAKNFGLPQNRERIMIVGFKNHNIEFEFPENTNIPTRLGDILEENPDEKYTISDKIWSSHQMRKERNKAKGNGFGYCLFNSESTYTSTISARYYKDGSEILIDQSDKGKNPRKLTPREAARLQGYPESFKIVVSDTQAYKQFGNSVPVNMIDAVAKKMYEALKKGGEI
jgi:DNA (cytosine-5)-methyltransferase 1